MLVLPNWSISKWTWHPTLNPCWFWNLKNMLRNQPRIIHSLLPPPEFSAFSKFNLVLYEILICTLFSDAVCFVFPLWTHPLQVVEPQHVISPVNELPAAFSSSHSHMTEVSSQRVTFTCEECAFVSCCLSRKVKNGPKEFQEPCPVSSLFLNWKSVDWNRKVYPWLFKLWGDFFFAAGLIGSFLKSYLNWACKIEF